MMAVFICESIPSSSRPALNAAPRDHCLQLRTFSVVAHPTVPCLSACAVTRAALASLIAQLLFFFVGMGRKRVCVALNAATGERVSRCVSFASCVQPRNSMLYMPRVFTSPRSKPSSLRLAHDVVHARSRCACSGVLGRGRRGLHGVVCAADDQVGGSALFLRHR
jgi:hypothetical protein